jgi:hypothetical protein
MGLCLGAVKTYHPTKSDVADLPKVTNRIWFLLPADVTVDAWKPALL